MKKDFTRSLTYIFCAFFSLSLCILLGCGSGGGGSSSSSTTTTVPPTTTTIQPTTDGLIGNFTFVYTITSTWTDRLIINQRSNLLSPEGTPYYNGFDVSLPTLTACLGAWYPSISRYIVTAEPLPSVLKEYTFAINPDNTLSGCWRISGNAGGTWSECYQFILPASRKTPLGLWDTEPQNYMDVNETIGKMFYEDQEAQAGESATPVDGDVVLKINELKAMIENHR